MEAAQDGASGNLCRTKGLGVEIGQLAFVVAMLLVAGVLSQLSRAETSTAFARVAIAYGIGTVATYWFVERAAQSLTII